jgi:signal peptidase II
VTDRQRRTAFLLAALGVFGVSQLASYLVSARLALHESYAIASFLHFTHIRNTGGIFGTLQNNSALFALVGGAFVAGVSTYVLKSRGLAGYQYVCFGFIVGAAASNVCDRLIYGAVVDFIDVQGIPHWNYIFNVADSAIHVGVWPMVIGSLLRRPSPVPPASS